MFIDPDGDVSVVLQPLMTIIAKVVPLKLLRRPDLFVYVDKDGHLSGMPMKATEVGDETNGTLSGSVVEVPPPEKYFESVGTISVDKGWLYWVGKSEVRRGRRVDDVPFIVDVESVSPLKTEVVFGFVDDDGTVWSLRSDVIERGSFA